VTDQNVSSVPPIPNRESRAAPENFSKGPAVAISLAVEASSSVKLVLNEAQFALVARADKFVQEVGVKAVEFASTRHASAVDVPDIEKAAEDLYPTAPVQSNPWTWGVLGIVAGALLSFLITILAPGIPDEFQPVAAGIAILALVGCVIWALKLVLPGKPE
jgi:hypothetical protein